MATLQQHLEQMQYSARSIEQLDFATPRFFTNALLSNIEITALIRDTEPHERGLFTVNDEVKQGSNVKRTALHNSGRGPPQSSTIARVLGSDMLQRIQQPHKTGQGSRGVDVDILLQGVERLCSAHEVPGARERLQQLRQKHDQVLVSINQYEEKVARQQSMLRQFNDGGGNASIVPPHATAVNPTLDANVTEDDITTEEETIRILEAKKKVLEQRVAETERDLGSLR